MIVPVNRHRRVWVGVGWGDSMKGQPGSLFPTSLSLIKNHSPWFPHPTFVFVSRYLGLWLNSPCRFRLNLSLSVKHCSLSLVTLSVRLVTVNVCPESVTFNLWLSVSVRRSAINFFSRSSIWHRAHELLQNFDVEITFWFICMSKFTDATSLSPRFKWRQRKYGLKILQGRLHTSWLSRIFWSSLSIWSVMACDLHGETCVSLSRIRLLTSPLAAKHK